MAVCKSAAPNESIISCVLGVAEGTDEGDAVGAALLAGVGGLLADGIVEGDDAGDCARACPSNATETSIARHETDRIINEMPILASNRAHRNIAPKMATLEMDPRNRFVGMVTGGFNRLA